MNNKLIIMDAKQYKDQIRRAEFSAQMGISSFATEGYTQAIETFENSIVCYEEVIARYGDTKDKKYQSEIIKNLFFIIEAYEKLEQYEKALEATNKAIEFTKDTNGETVFPKEKNELNDLLDKVTALDAKQYKDQIRRAEFSAQMGISSFATEGYTQAIETFENSIVCYEEVIARYGDTKDKKYQSEIIKNLFFIIEAYEKLEQYEKALEATNKAIEFTKDTNGETVFPKEKNELNDLLDKVTALDANQMKK
ncbi:hypothetical protein ACFL4D_01965 [Candidatus Margulisiibacteriota bacterium]